MMGGMGVIKQTMVLMAAGVLLHGADVVGATPWCIVVLMAWCRRDGVLIVVFASVQLNGRVQCDEARVGNVHGGMVIMTGVIFNVCFVWAWHRTRRRINVQ